MMAVRLTWKIDEALTMLMETIRYIIEYDVRLYDHPMLQKTSRAYLLRDHLLRWVEWRFVVHCDAKVHYHAEMSTVS